MQIATANSKLEIKKLVIYENSYFNTYTFYI